MSRLRRNLARLLVALLLSGAASATATTYLALTLPELLERTELAFYGTVSSVVVEERDGEPWTVVEFEVERPLTGLGNDEQPLELAFLGGELAGGETLRVNLMPGFVVGEQVLVLAYDEQYLSPIVGFDQGLWRRIAGEFVDERGRRLGLDDSGRLTAGGVTGEGDLVLDAVARELAAQR